MSPAPGVFDCSPKRVDGSEDVVGCYWVRVTRPVGDPFLLAMSIGASVSGDTM